MDKRHFKSAIFSFHSEKVIDMIADHKRSRWGCNSGRVLLIFYDQQFKDFLDR